MTNEKQRDRERRERELGLAEVTRRSFVNAARNEAPAPVVDRPRALPETLTLDVRGTALILTRQDTDAEYRGLTVQGVRVSVWRAFERGKSKWRGRVAIPGYANESGLVADPQTALDAALRAMLRVLRRELDEATARHSIVDAMIFSEAKG